MTPICLFKTTKVVSFSRKMMRLLKKKREKKNNQLDEKEKTP